MTRTLPQNLIDEGQRLHNPLPWWWLYEIELDVTTINRTIARLVNADEIVSWNSKNWYPYPITHGEITQDTEGNLPQLELVLANVRRDFVRYLSVSQGMTNLLVTITLVHKAHVATGDNVPSMTFQVRGAAATDQALVLTLEMPNFYEVPIPKDMYMRNRCRWRFKGTECGYQGTNTHCTKRMTGVDGCIFHGDDERANRRPVLHPGNYGAFPGLPRRVV